MLNALDLLTYLLSDKARSRKQAGAELGQAQLKLRLAFN